MLSDWGPGQVKGLSDVRPRVGKQRGKYTGNVLHRDRRSFAIAERKPDLIRILDRIGSEDQEEAVEQHGRAHVHDR